MASRPALFLCEVLKLLYTKLTPSGAFLVIIVVPGPAVRVLYPAVEVFASDLKHLASH
jgi:hypothetical protein